MEGDWRQNIISTTPKGISIHSLRMEGDETKNRLKNLRIISIHSLRMEGDHLDIPDAEDTKHFNPLPPHGGRHQGI